MSEREGVRGLVGARVSVVAAFAIALGGCTDAERASLFAYGDEARVVCYSGGNVIFDDVSTGKVQPIDGEGITFRSKQTDGYVRAFADCIVFSGGSE